MAEKEILLEREQFELKPKSGGGVLSYEERFQREWKEIVGKRKERS
ncbi:MAG: hypothetical protein HYU77_14795 [Betaproteobacteria bacterium]|nr:hypothetical protein [Betaproteobacteria bacterium]